MSCKCHQSKLRWEPAVETGIELRLVCHTLLARIVGIARPAGISYSLWSVRNRRDLISVNRRTAGKTLAVVCAFTILAMPSANAVELKSETAAAFDRYIRATERQI